MVIDMDYTLLYENHYKRLYLTVFTMIKDHYLSEDIIQETFIKAIEKADSISDEGKIGAWLTTIARRTTIDFIRKEKRSDYTPLDEEIVMGEEGIVKKSVEQNVEWEILKGEIELEINTLRKEQQRIIHLKINNGWKEREIARFLNMSTGAVKINMFRARQYLRTRFHQQFTA